METVKALEVTDEASYLEADEVLGRIRAARTKWRLRMSDILDPLKEAVQAAKRAMTGADGLYQEVDTPMAQMEVAVKGAMREYKIEEARRLQAVEEERQAKAAKALAEAKAKQEAAAKAKTVQMKAKLQEQAAQAERTAVAVAAPPLTAGPVKGAASTVRRVQKAVVQDTQAFIQAVASGRVPPVHDGAVFVIINHAAINKVFKSNPELVASWPGVVVEEDVIIAGR
jgi:hypothetical protein